MTTYAQGQTVRISATFINTQTQVPIAMSAVELRVLSADGIETDTMTADLTNPSTGVFYLDVVVYAPGIWNYRFISTTPIYAANEKSFQVATTPFLVGYGAP